LSPADTQHAFASIFIGLYAKITEVIDPSDASESS